MVSGPAKRRLASIAGHGVGRETRALLHEDADLVLPVDLVEGEGDEAELLGVEGLQRLALRSFASAATFSGLADEAGFQPASGRCPSGIRAEIAIRQRDRRDRAGCRPRNRLPSCSCGRRRTGSPPACRRSRIPCSTSADQRARGDVDALQHPLPVEQHLARQPVVAVGRSRQLLVRQATFSGIALGSEDEHAEFRFVQPQVQDRVVEFARQRAASSKPAPFACKRRPMSIGGASLFGTGERDRGGSASRSMPTSTRWNRSPSRRRQMLPLAAGVRRDALRIGRAGPTGRRTPSPAPPPASSKRELGRPRRPGRQSFAFFAAHALFGGAEDVGEVAAHLALVGHPGQAAGAGQHGEQRHLGQRHRRTCVVGQDDVVAGQRQLVAAAGAGAWTARCSAGRNPRRPRPR